MNNPYPSASNRRLAEAVEAVLAEQAENTETFNAVVETARRRILDLHFPLGSPAYGIDLSDVYSSLVAWQVPREPERLLDDAYDFASVQLGLS